MNNDFLKSFMKQQRSKGKIQEYNEKNKIPLTAEQKRLWFLYELEPAGTDYNMCIPIHIEGEIKIEILEQAFKSVISRHEALRLSFYKSGNEVWQKVNEEVEFYINYCEFRSSSNSKETAYEWITQCSKQPFDLENVPLINCYGARYSKHGIYFLIVLHHIITDGWSTGILMKELTEIYNSMIHHIPITLKNPEVQYSDYAIYRNNLFHDSSYMEGIENYWLSKIPKDIQEVNMMTGCAAQKKSKGKVKRIVIENQIYILLLECKKLVPNLSVYMILVAALRVLIFKYTNLTKVILGSPLANRNSNEVKNTFGYFADMVMLYTEIKEEESFVELLERERNTILESYLNQDLPYEYITKQLGRERNLLKNPLYQVALSYMNDTKKSYVFGNAHGDIVEIQRGGAALDLFFMLYQREGQIDGWVEYNQNSYPDELVEFLIRNYIELLNTVCRKPEILLKDIAIPLPVEYKKMIHTGSSLNQCLPSDERNTKLTERYTDENLEKLIVNMWRDLLGNKKIDANSNFFDFNGDSLLALKFIYKINDEFNIDIKIKDIFVYQTVKELISNSINKKIVYDYIDLSKEIDLDFDLKEIMRKSENSDKSKIHKIFLTGCTGFFGRFLLSELLENYTSYIYCLVRAESKEKGNERIKTILEENDLWKTDYEDRVIAVCGDLQKKNLGIAENEYRELCKEIDTIFHNGAIPSYLADYSSLKPCNIQGTKEIIKLAALHKIKPIHFTSTLMVFESGKGKKVHEYTDISLEKHLNYPGYFASKWVAENIIEIAKKEGIPCVIYRLGLVLGDTKAGRYDSHQWFYVLIKSIMEMGYTFDRMPDLDHFIIPVDVAAKNLVAISKNRSHYNEIIHLASKHRIQVYRLIEKCNGFWNHNIQTISLFDWIQKAKKQESSECGISFLAFIQDLAEYSQSELEDWIKVSDSIMVDIDSSCSHDIIKKEGITFEEPDDKLVKKWIYEITQEEVKIL